MIDLEHYKSITDSSKQVLFDYFEDPNAVENLQLYLYQRGWRVVPIEKQELK